MEVCLYDMRGGSKIKESVTHRRSADKGKLWNVGLTGQVNRLLWVMSPEVGRQIDRTSGAFNYCQADIANCQFFPLIGQQPKVLPHQETEGWRSI